MVADCIIFGFQSMVIPNITTLKLHDCFIASDLPPFSVALPRLQTLDLFCDEKSVWNAISLLYCPTLQSLGIREDGMYRQRDDGRFNASWLPQTTRRPKPTLLEWTPLEGRLDVVATFETFPTLEKLCVVIVELRFAERAALALSTPQSSVMPNLRVLHVINQLSMWERYESEIREIFQRVLLTRNDLQITFILDENKRY